MNLSILIPTYTDHQIVYHLLKYLETQKISLNHIFVISDRLEIDAGIDVIANTLKYKSQIHAMKHVTSITKSTHGGRIGITQYVYDMNIPDDENLIVLEDDLFAERGFFEQCDHFFKHLYSKERPIFVGYSRANSDKEEFFDTYNLLHLWGFALKFGELKSIIAYHDLVRKYTPEQKQKIIDDVLGFKYPCEIFEKYKAELVERVKRNFLATSKESADLYFMFYLLQNKRKIVKNTKSYVYSKGRSEKVNLPNDIEMDLKNALVAFVD